MRLTGCAAFLIPHLWRLTVLTLIHTRSFSLPFTMVTFFCELCNCFFPPTGYSLNQHQSGRRHLRNVASSGLLLFDTPQQSPLSWPESPNTSPPSDGDAPTPTADPRVTVSDEGGLEFLVVGTGDPNPSFFPSSHTVLITKTEVKSKIFVKRCDLVPLSSLNSQYELFCDTLL
jgi:hypothetical protein